ncbi:ATP-dependent nuclease [Haliscomenobacter hydrossis]|uniref:ABC transporter domain-containing protein n=1 Tax=Haliscomenobacter hydrossis (strain ATCC 27775 / DSM 1100 / LMG 10767 / O) TaxID=760192 RepID=F4KQ67_HALH1|nr:ATP-binding protein [Haliscomenobacter hydrossis]AEE54228.1 hypothetical protein Halhy_6409 [Haliscomenobacter hydrossis DSM 1100]
MRIRKLRIENFKKFQKLEVEFQELDCLIGGNNSGKSTLLQALALFDFCLHQCLSKTNGKPITLKNRSIPEEDFVVLPVTKGTDLWYDKSLQARGKHILILIEVTFDNGKKVKTTLDFNFNRFSVNTETAQDEKWLNELKNFKISYLPVFSTFQTKEEKRTQIAVRNELGRGNVNAVIRNLLLSLKDEKRADDLVQILQRSFPSIKKLKIEFDEASMQFISVTYLEEEKKKDFDIFSAGSGFQQFIYLFGFILLEQPNVILLDEPDVHLHGQLQKSLFDELSLFAKTDKQILFATHSRDLISAVLPENIIHLNSGFAERLQLDYQVYNALEELGSMENTQLVTLQEFRRVLVVENQDDLNYIQHFGKLILGEAKMQEINKRLAVCFAYGNPCKQDMAKFRRSLQTMFTKTGSPVKMMVIADRDYFPFVEELVDSLKKDEHIIWHIWIQNEIENYLLSSGAILRLVTPRSSSSQQLNLDDELIDKQVKDIIQNQKNEIEGRFLKGFEEYSGRFKKGWDITTLLSKAKEMLEREWSNPLPWVDAKKTISTLVGWLQANGYQSFSNKKILEVLQKEDLPVEIHTLMHDLGEFAGVVK